MAKKNFVVDSTKKLEKDEVHELAREEVPLVLKLLIALLCTILGFNFANGEFFALFPLFGSVLLSEILFSALAGGFGYFVIPVVYITAKYALYRFIFEVVSDIVSNFWEQQTKRMHEVRRLKQKEKAKKLKEDISGGTVLDTSVLVDGRISDITRLGFIPRKLIIPTPVMSELHLISDSEDNLKRQKGRRGLDTVNLLRKEKDHLLLFPEFTGKTSLVDKTLVEFCKKHKLGLMTLDFNLNKLAATQGIKILNINELVEVIKSKYLPGEKFIIKILQEGKEDNQGVGYLEDGTMIVVEEAKDKVGQELEVTVKKVIQGPAGKMLFCKL